MSICKECGKELKEGFEANCIKCGVVICDECSLGNKFQCTTCLPKENHIAEYVRRSHIELYKVCPYAYYLEVIKQIPMENNIYADMGIILHDIFDHHSNNLQEPTNKMFDQFKKWFQEVPDKKFIVKNVKSDLKEKLYHQGISCIENYITKELTMPKPFATEETIFTTIDPILPKIRITFDRINKVGDELHVVDYKTGKLYVGKKLVTDLQIPTYILAIQEKYKMQVDNFTYLFLSEGKERTYHRINNNEYMCTVGKKEYIVNIQERIREIKQIFARIKANNFSVPHNINEWHCENMCAFGINGICAKGDAQRWKTYK